MSLAAPAGFEPTPHPVLKLPSFEQGLALGEDELCKLLEKREKLIKLEREDPYRYGFYLDCWHDADALLEEAMMLCLFGGNGAGKTWFMARKGLQVMLDNPGAKVLWLHESEPTSILVHQSAVWHYMPAELKIPVTKRSRIRNINYSIANGFSDNRFVLPNGSIGVFGAYKQQVGDYEGTGWSLICADENFPLGWLKTLMVRLPRCKGKMVWGYTPLIGITKAIKHVVEGATTVKSLPAKLLDAHKVHVNDCPRGHMPYIQKSVWADIKILYCFADMNPFGGYEDLVRVLQRMSVVEIERRAYGYARNTIRLIFPKFCAVHIVEPEDVPQEGTIRHYADPAGARNMFMIWCKTDRDNRRFVYREWPDIQGYGEWAVPSEDSNRWDGAPGPAQPTLGYGIMDYKRIVLELEGNRLEEGGWNLCGESVFERSMDPRSGAARTLTEHKGGQSIIDLMMEEQRDRDGVLVGAPMPFEAAPGLTEDQGIIAVNDLLAFNQDEKVCPIINEPMLYVSSACQNLIFALKNYTKHDGENAACKDPIDCLRYLATGESGYVDPAALQARGGGSY